MSLFDEDGNGMVSAREFVEAMGEQYEEEGAGEQGDEIDDDFAMEEEAGDQALPEGHQLGKQIEKQQEIKIVEMEKRLAKSYSQSRDHILSFFGKY